MEALRKISQELNLPQISGETATLVQKTRGDRVIWSIVAILAIMSLLVVYSSTGSLAYKNNKGNTEYYLFKQIAFIIIGIGIIYFTHLMNYTVFSRLALWLYILSIPLLVYTLFFGAQINEASRWIKLPVLNMTVQTSDLARLALFMYLARQLSRKQDVITDFKKGFIPLVMPIVITCGLIAPANLSTALLTGATGFLLLFMGRVSLKHMLLAIGVAALPVVLLVMIALKSYDPNAGATENTSRAGIKEKIQSKGRVGTWMKRIQDFVYGSNEKTPYQVQQAKTAIAKGGWVGLGPGNCETCDFLPQAYNDFIYASLIEEYGMIGAVLIVFLYLMFLYRCIRIFRKCPYAFGAFLALGLSVTFVIQAASNMAVNVNLFPVTGVTLPLVSMGGSSFLFTCFSVGLILSVSRNVENLEGKAARQREKEAAAAAEEEAIETEAVPAA